jgi:hypothetical protein
LELATNPQFWTSVWNTLVKNFYAPVVAGEFLIPELRYTSNWHGYIPDIIF